MSTFYITEDLSVDDMFIDPRVQRTEGVSARRVEEMSNSFNPAALGTLTLSERVKNGVKTYAVIDGAHRRAACERVKWSGTVPAKVHVGLTLEQEATLFRLMNDFVSPSAVSKFLVRVIENEPVAVDMAAILNKYSLVVHLQPKGHNSVSAVAACERVYRGGGILPKGTYPAVFDTTIRVITSAWPKSTSATHGVVVEAVGQIVARVPSVDVTRLIERLATIEPLNALHKGMGLQKAQGGKTAAAVARVLVGEYNKGLRLEGGRYIDWPWTR